jgi:flagellar biosynthesis/type III secretory pathway chaperone
VSELIEDLMAVLAAQTDELRALVPLLDEQQAALARADGSHVTAVMLRQEPVLRRLLRLEQRRRVVVDGLASHLGIDGGGLSLSTLVARLPGAAAALTTLRDEMQRLLEAVDVRNRRNAFLIDRAAACIEGLMRAVMTTGAEPAPVYVASGRPAHRGQAPRLVDRRA